MISFYRNKENALRLEDIKVDMHSHLIPGIDDGSRSMEETIAILRKFSALGYQKVITTPHIKSDLYKNTPKIIQTGLREVRRELKDKSLNIQIEAASEYYCDEYFLALIAKEDLLTFGENNVLFEFPFVSKPNNIAQYIFALKEKGYQPVLAHYERYAYFHSEKLQPAKYFREQGVDIQLNLLSLTGFYGDKIRKQAERMVNQKMVDYVGTDCHRMKYLENIERHLQHKYFRKLKALNLKNKYLL